jgi:mannose-6-phosphate isomerase
MDLLQPVIRSYDWGSRHAIADLQGRPVPAPGPEAELWMGAHPSAPSGLATANRALDAVIAADPDRELGPDCVARFGPRLPFLLKVLSADRALSIQVHPSRAQAQAGFGRADPNYVDDWPKPELLCALTPFEVLAGLRTPADAAALLHALDVPALASVLADLAAATGPEALSRALAAILTWPDPEPLIESVLAACRTLAAEKAVVCSLAVPGPYAAACAAAIRAAADHPGDLGVVAMLLLNHAVLAPGRAMFMPAGGLHAYLSGTGIEVLANSDNVVRAGLTSKPIDVPELLDLLDPAVTVPVLSPIATLPPDSLPTGSPAAQIPGVAWFDTPAPEFRLYTANLAEPEVPLPGGGPRIVLCTTGTATLRTAGDQVKLARGESCFVSAADGPLSAAGPARLFLAAPGPG